MALDAHHRPQQPGANPSRGGVHASIALVFAAVALATLSPLWRAEGWPVNHDNAFGVRTYIYARHFSWLDLMPIWSSLDVSGFGSPMPLMYHKLFYMMAGVLALATNTVKSADVATIAALLVIGATGLYCTLREIGASRLAATVAGCCLIAANYTVTNWLVRGALAEFAAAMLIPWIFLLLIRTIQSSSVRPPLELGVAFGLLWLSHSVLAFFVGLLVGSTYLLLAAVRVAPWSALHPRAAWPAVLCFTLLVGPYLVPMAVIGPDYDFTRILTPPMRPEYQFRPVLDYVWDQTWRFGRTRTGLTVQLDQAMLMLLGASLVMLVARGPDDPGSTRWLTVRPVLPLIVVLALASSLQVRSTAPFYAWMPGAVFIQFPWRLLALITPALVGVAVYLADRTLPRDARLFGLGAAGAWMLAGCGALAPLQDPRISVEPQPVAVSFSGFREYEPVAAPALEELQAAISARWAQAGCRYDRAIPGHEEVAEVRFVTSCGRATVLPLPLYASPLHLVTSSNYARSQPCLPVPELPTVCGAIVPAAEGSVTVRLPTIASLGGWAWRRIRGVA